MSVRSEIQRGKRSAATPTQPTQVRAHERSTISSKGQMTVPIEVRKRLGLREGDQVDFVFEDGRTVLRPVRSVDDPFAKWMGIAPGTGGIQETLKREREMRGYEEDGD